MLGTPTARALRQTQPTSPLKGQYVLLLSAGQGEETPFALELGNCQPALTGLF